MQMTPEQCRAARMYFDMTRDELAKLARVGRNTIARFETGTGINESTLIALEAFFDRRGVRFPDRYTIVFPRDEERERVRVRGREGAREGRLGG